MLMIILALLVVFAKSTFQLWSQVLKIKLLHCLKKTKELVDWSVGGTGHKSVNSRCLYCINGE